MLRFRHRLIALATFAMIACPARAETASEASDADVARDSRAALLAPVASWGYQLAGLDRDKAKSSPFDLLVVDATTGLKAERPFHPTEVASLKQKPDGRRRIVISYLSVGEAEDYRGDYFAHEYLEEEPPDWLLKENPRWKGNRLVRFCSDGWQRTILGDDAGRSVYNSIDPSPLQRLIEAGFDGVYLDRVDVYQEVEAACPGAKASMIAFMERLSAQARRVKPDFLVILQNAEELLDDNRMIRAIDAVAKESLFYGEDFGQKPNDASSVRDSIRLLKLAKAAGRPVFVIDYVTGKATIAAAKRRITAEGFIPYIGPRELDALWLPGVNF
jgi:cysteinyl-tRNA synthetase